MKDRIRQIMEDKGMTQKFFASELCIAEATISGIFTGRTRPTNQTIQAIHERFPEVNISWLMFGEGDMYIESNSNSSGSRKDDDESGQPSVPNDGSANASSFPPSSNQTQPDLFSSFDFSTPSTPASREVQRQTPPPPQVKIIEKYIDKPMRKITEIRVFFDDGTYETFSK